MGIVCKDIDEANYLLAIINSGSLYEAVQPLMAKGQFGARHLQKHLWELPMPEYDAANPLHREIAEAGTASARLAELRSRRDDRLTVTIARRELRGSAEGAAVEGGGGTVAGGWGELAGIHISVIIGQGTNLLVSSEGRPCSSND